MNKRLITSSLLVVLLLFNCCSGYKKSNDSHLKKSKHFIIYADADDDIIFSKLQDDLNISPKMERYTIKVDLTADDSSLHYVVINDHERFAWMKLSQEVRSGLINWTGSNKEVIR